MSNPEQNPSGTPDPYGTPQDPAAGQAPQAPQYGAPAGGAPQAPQYGAPQAPQYGAPQAPAPQGYGAEAPATDPGKTLGIVGLVLSILGCTSLIGLILSIVALSKSKKAGYKNGIALAGIIVGAVLLVTSIVVGIVLLVAGGAAVTDLLEACENVSSGDTVVWEGQQVVCP
ncbi:DUF4190 domain-containing protein [Oerskovia sp. Sa1BUA8]|uniref:DUF4190 domain-containing protein n=1 Tax=Oerskovia douganii TaxID=2762210 RepID=A0A9D5YY98_9CELL|nr:DUF4190 domain-containing protein [Oerskovia douganii]MBE7699727.1 DUF4190 domain-containing protein [Oerskovia douganii]